MTTTIFTIAISMIIAIVVKLINSRKTNSRTTNPNPASCTTTSNTTNPSTTNSNENEALMALIKSQSEQISALMAEIARLKEPAPEAEVSAKTEESAPEAPATETTKAPVTENTETPAVEETPAEEAPAAEEIPAAMTRHRRAGRKSVKTPEAPKAEETLAVEVVTAEEVPAAEEIPAEEATEATVDETTEAPAEEVPAVEETPAKKAPETPAPKATEAPAEEQAPAQTNNLRYTKDGVTKEAYVLPENLNKRINAALAKGYTIEYTVTGKSWITRKPKADKADEPKSKVDRKITFAQFRGEGEDRKVELYHMWGSWNYMVSKAQLYENLGWTVFFRVGEDDRWCVNAGQGRYAFADVATLPQELKDLNSKSSTKTTAPKADEPKAEPETEAKPEVEEPAPIVYTLYGVRDGKKICHDFLNKEMRDRQIKLYTTAGYRVAFKDSADGRWFEKKADGTVGLVEKKAEAEAPKAEVKAEALAPKAEAPAPKAEAPKAEVKAEAPKAKAKADEPKAAVPKTKAKAKKDAPAKEAAPAPQVTEVWTDGSCLGNGAKNSRGGWAYICNGKEVSGSEANTTNNRMELRAVLEAMKALADGSNVIIYSDSKYVGKAINAYLSNWVEKGWKASNGKAPANVDLWKEYVEQAKRLGSIKVSYVEGHVGIALNEKCDALAKAAAKSLA